MIVMNNGASVKVEASWALNTLHTEEAKVGADMVDGLRINGKDVGMLYVRKIDQPKRRIGMIPVRAGYGGLRWKCRNGSTRLFMIRNW